jgi:hypothetical protein
MGAHLLGFRVHVRVHRSPLWDAFSGLQSACGDAQVAVMGWRVPEHGGASDAREPHLNGQT